MTRNQREVLSLAFLCLWAALVLILLVRDAQPGELQTQFPSPEQIAAWTDVAQALNSAGMDTSKLTIHMTAVPPRPLAKGEFWHPDMTCRLRDKRGQVVRSRSRRNLYQMATGWPKGRPGYHVDHVVPLACGGCDVPSNMVWVRADLKRKKDAVERRPCNQPMIRWDEALLANQP